VVKRILVLAAIVAVTLVFSSGALASSRTCAHGANCGSGNLGGPTGNGNGNGTLPFTGLNLAGIAGAGGLLLVGGLTLQRASRRRR